MKKVFEHPASHEVGLCESILTSNGIPAEIRNRGISSLVGEVPFTEAWQELWVLNDADCEPAMALLREYHQPAADAEAAESWTCANCGESVPGNFDACWKCQTARTQPEPA